MNLDQVTIEIRPRSAWEAVDLGLLMAKRWWLPMMKLWLLVSLPILILCLLLPSTLWWLSALLLWWLKPLCERPLLHILSHAVFNDLPSTRSTLKTAPRLITAQIFASLTWRRFSPSRSMDLPVLQLEGLNSTKRQERLGILHREDSSPAHWISFTGLILEVCLWLGLGSLLWALVPSEINIEWANFFFDQESPALITLNLIIWYIALALSAPFYVACGFALYLNRRIKLEAWDIDIAFRRIANKRSPVNALSALLFAFTLGLAIFSADAQRSAYADDQLPAIETPAAESDTYNGPVASDKPVGELVAIDRSQALESINAVMQQQEFSRKEIQRLLKSEKTKKVKKKDDEIFKSWETFFEFLRNFEGFLAAASLLEILLWAAVLALIVFVVHRYRHWLAAQFVRVAPVAAPKTKPVTLFGMEVTRESLPEDISTHALRLLEAGDIRAALALLYRASLFHLIHSGVEIHDGHTERECAELMRLHFEKNPALQTRVDYFSSLTRTWQQLAYGHIAPSSAATHQLCATWNQYWLHHSATPVQGAA